MGQSSRGPGRTQLPEGPVLYNMAFTIIAITIAFINKPLIIFRFKFNINRARIFQPTLHTGNK